MYQKNFLGTIAADLDDPEGWVYNLHNFDQQASTTDSSSHGAQGACVK